MAQASADIALEDAAGDTMLTFAAAGHADGGIMRLGRAIIGNSAQRVIDGFFESIGTQMGVTVRSVARE
jgi:carbon monoxide dehydrogenase subunit G